MRRIREPTCQRSASCKSTERRRHRPGTWLPSTGHRLESRTSGNPTIRTEPRPLGSSMLAPSPTSLIHVVWELTLACDLACGHCGSRAGAPRSAELSTHEALEVVHQLAEMGTRERTLIGGDAYLREDWHVIARAIHDAGMMASMVTGGRGMTKAAPSSLKTRNRSTLSESCRGRPRLRSRGPGSSA